MYQHRQLCLLLSLLLLAYDAAAQCRSDVLMTVNPNGDGDLAPAIGASVRVCLPGATGYPCTPLATLYTDQTLGTVQPLNPISTDSFGNYTFCSSTPTVYLESTYKGTIKVQPTYVIAPGAGTGGGGIQTINGNNNPAQTVVGLGAAQVTSTGGQTTVYVPTGTTSGPVLSSITLNPASVQGGGTSTGTVALSGLAPTGGALTTLSSSNTAAAQVPANVTVPANSATVTFNITTSPVAANTAVTISGVYSVTQSATLTVLAPPPPPQPIYGGVGQPGASSNVTLSGTNVTLSTGDVIGQLQTTPEQVGQQWSFSPNNQAIYLLLFGGSHSFVDANTGFPLPFNPPIAVSLNGVPMFLYQTTNILFLPFTPKIVN